MSTNTLYHRAHSALRQLAHDTGDVAACRDHPAATRFAAHRARDLHSRAIDLLDQAEALYSLSATPREDTT